MEIPQSPAEVKAVSPVGLVPQSLRVALQLLLLRPLASWILALVVVLYWMSETYPGHNQ
jgi:hypothetical protein